MIFVNKDIYYSLGDYQAESGNLAAMLKQAWCSATRLTHPDFMPLVHFGRTHYLDRNDPNINQQIRDVLEYADYLAKNVTKHYGNGERSIGSSV